MNMYSRYTKKKILFFQQINSYLALAGMASLLFVPGPVHCKVVG